MDLEALDPSIWEAGKSELQASLCYRVRSLSLPHPPKGMAATEGRGLKFSNPQLDEGLGVQRKALLLAESPSLFSFLSLAHTSASKRSKKLLLASPRLRHLTCHNNHLKQSSQPKWFPSAMAVSRE